MEYLFVTTSVVPRCRYAGNLCLFVLAGGTKNHNKFRTPEVILTMSKHRQMTVAVRHKSKKSKADKASPSMRYDFPCLDAYCFVFRLHPKMTPLSIQIQTKCGQVNADMKAYCRGTVRRVDLTSRIHIGSTCRPSV